MEIKEVMSEDLVDESSDVEEIEDHDELFDGLEAVAD